MPVVSVERDMLFEAIGKTYTEEEFDELCFQFGIELDDVTSERKEKEKMFGQNPTPAQLKELEQYSDAEVYKIEIGANRYDLLCLEGISTALRVFTGAQAPPAYVTKPATGLELHVEEEVVGVRKHIVAAALRGVRFTEASYKRFIDLQEKLHRNICRERTLASVGTHDLATVAAPFRYRALPPKEIRFVPLKRSEEVDGAELMQLLDEDLHLRQYLSIIREKERYPVIYDAQDRVLSLPPIINGRHSQITLDTRDILIECTGLDRLRVETVVYTICAMFSQYCEEPFAVEQVTIVHADGRPELFPDMGATEHLVPLAYVNSVTGLGLGAEEACGLLRRMLLPATAEGEAGAEVLRVQAPPTRSDILHACDVAEDVAIAYGYDNLPSAQPPTVAFGAQQPLNRFTDLLRMEMAATGFTEVLSFSLISRRASFAKMRRSDDPRAVVLARPENSKFEIGRTQLLPGLMKTLKSNKTCPLPIRIFEASDVMLCHADSEVGAVNQRNLAAVFCSHQSGFEALQGVLEQLMVKLQLMAPDAPTPTQAYELVSGDDPAFFPGFCANVLVKGKKVGVIGVLHPEVLRNFDIGYPCSAFELNIQALL